MRNVTCKVPMLRAVWGQTLGLSVNYSLLSLLSPPKCLQYFFPLRLHLGAPCLFTVLSRFQCRAENCCMTKGKATLFL